MADFQIALIAGDGIGVDVSAAARAVVEAAIATTGIALEWRPVRAGAGCFAETGRDIEQNGEETAGKADAIFLGAIGLPSIRHDDGTEISPHLRLRDRFGLYAGVRPVKAYPNIPRRLADERAASIDFVVLRESTEGLFYSAAANNGPLLANDDEVRDVLRITRPTTEKLVDFAFTLAGKRNLAGKRRDRGGKGHVTCVDKANVFASMAFFRKIFDERRTSFPDIEAAYAYVDAMALDLIRRPWDFDVLVTENMFGDILSDLAGGLVGGMGMAACAEIGDAHGLFQPAHGSAPDIVGEDKANPLAAILSGAMMLDYLADRPGASAHQAKTLRHAASRIDAAVENGFAQDRIRPMEFGGDMGTKAVTTEVIAQIARLD